MRRLLALALLLSAATAHAADWSVVDRIMTRAGKVSGDVHKYGFPRTDLHVMVRGLGVEPALALGSWVAFQPHGEAAMVAGDLVVTPTELDPVVRELQSRGLAVLAIHNHLAGETPHVLYIHFMGHGDAAALAGGVMSAIGKTKTPTGATTPSTFAKPPVFDRIEQRLGRTGTLAGRVLQIGVPRAEPIRDGDVEVPPAMGMATALNFQVHGKRVAATGDFELLASEVGPVMRELTAHGIAVTALHSHMLSETPRLFFMHFWVDDDADRVADGLKAALGKMAVK